MGKILIDKMDGKESVLIATQNTVLFALGKLKDLKKKLSDIRITIRANAGSFSREHFNYKKDQDKGEAINRALILIEDSIENLIDDRSIKLTEKRILELQDRILLNKK